MNTRINHCNFNKSYRQPCPTIINSLLLEFFSSMPTTTTLICTHPSKLSPFLSKNLSISRRQSQNLLKSNLVTINSQKPTSYQLVENDIVRVEIVEQQEEEEEGKKVWKDQDCRVELKIAGERMQESLNYIPKSASGLALFALERINTTDAISTPIQTTPNNVEITNCITNTRQCQYTMLCKQLQPIQQLESILESHSAKISNFTLYPSNSCTLVQISIIFNLPFTTNIKKLMAANGFPILGNSRFTTTLKSTKNRGDYLIVDKVWTTTKLVQLELPLKFNRLKEREKIGVRESVDYDRVMEFCGLEFNISKSTLVPRKSSTILVTTMLKHIRTRCLGESTIVVESTSSSLDKSSSLVHSSSLDTSSTLDKSTIVDQITNNPPTNCNCSNFTILDLGCGVGNLIIPILKHHPNLNAIAIDCEPIAITTTIQNAKHHNVKLNAYEATFKSPNLKQRIDYIICNPPYLTTNQQVKFALTDPTTSTVALQNGYQYYFQINELLSNQPQSIIILVLEVGSGMAENVTKIFSKFRVVEIVKDEYGIDRCIVFENRIDSSL